ncbi:MAG: hypothetical protein B7X74_03150, partial [Thiotrichales bacterium 39-47-5]
MMQWLYNFSVRGKLIFLTSIMLFLMLLLAVFAIYKMGQLDAADTQLYEQELL